MDARPSTKPITDADLLALGPKVRAEVVNGELITDMTPNKADHSFYSAQVILYLGFYVKLKRIGRVFGDMMALKLDASEESGIRGARVPDAAYFSYERLAVDAPLDIFPTIAPEWVLEVISPGESHTDVLRKTADYLDHGVLLVWHVLPALHEIRVYTHEDRAGRVYSMADNLPGENLFTDLSIPVRAIFDPADSALYMEYVESLIKRSQR
jgi:Uma2 family endonuclease